VTPASYNKKSNLAIVCPITSRVKGYPFEVALPKGVSIAGVILADQLKSVDWQQRRGERLGELIA
jgi:mRNA interferase MazF